MEYRQEFIKYIDENTSRILQYIDHRSVINHRDNTINKTKNWDYIKLKSLAQQQKPKLQCKDFLFNEKLCPHNT